MTSATRRAIASKTNAQARAQKKAELYYRKMHEKGCFGDSYNANSLLWLFDLSWWRDVGDHLMDGQGRMCSRHARRFLALLHEREAVFRANLRRASLALGETRVECARYFHDRYAELKAFLNEAIQRGEAIDCSL